MSGDTVLSESAEKLRHVNAVLLKLSQDEDLQDDLTLAPVKVAIDHWTGVKRLDVDKAQQLQNNRRVVYVLQRFQMLQCVCKDAGMPVPLDHLLSGKTKLDQNIVEKYFGPKNVHPAVQKVFESVDKSEPPSVTEKHVHLAPSSVPITSSDKDSTNGPNTEKVFAIQNGYDVNTILKVLIAIVFVLIAVTWAQLL